MTTQLVFRGSRAELADRVRQLPAILAGKQHDINDIARGFKLRVASAVLSEIQLAFIVKADGGTDFGGVKWPYLSRKYLAYGRRFGPGEQAELKRQAGIAGTKYRYAPGDKKGLLTKGELKRWRQLYGRALAWKLTKGMDEREAKAQAAAYAWSVLKSEGAKTKLEVYGSRKVQVLRDTGVLLSSLSPAITGVPESVGKGIGDGKDRILHLGTDTVEVGTNVPYAAKHHYGINTPKRRLWPAPANWPNEVWGRITGTATRGIVHAIGLALIR